MRWPGSALCALMVALLASCAPAPDERGPGSADASAPGNSEWQSFDLGPHHREVSTDSADAQLAFDQGLVWAYAFNHDEAIRAFREAARRDPSLAMAHWGVALANGPHINNPFVEEARAKAAWEALGRARELADGASPVEQALIAALESRYAWPQPEDRRPLDEAYAAAMGQVHERFPDDADVATLYAESLLDLHPWDQWEQDGDPKEGTLEVLALLERAIELDPRHPGALHLWIHSYEASQQPERAVEAAGILRTLVPDASHLLHMPAHIDARIGDWAAAAAANEVAIAADARYLARDPEVGFYALYMIHNVHFLAFSAMMEGRSALALEKSSEIAAALTPEKVREAPLFLESFMGARLDGLKRFGKWQEILDTPAPGEEFQLATTYWHFARGVALAALGRVDEAEVERALFEKGIPKVSKEAYWGSNYALDVLEPAVPYPRGEIAYRRGDFDRAIEELTASVELEDALKFDDPPPWTTPARHALGAVLLEAGRHAEAERVYLADLERYPRNGWSLHGLSKALIGQGKSKRAAAVQARFEKAWERADIPMRSSCLCVMPGSS